METSLRAKWAVEHVKKTAVSVHQPFHFLGMN